MRDNDPLMRHAHVQEVWVRAMRAREGWELEKEFRTTFERFVFDMGLEPAEAEVRTLAFLKILKAHQYKDGKE